MSSIIGGIVCFAMFCLTLYLIFKPKGGGSECNSDNSGHNSNQSPKEAMMSRAPIGLLNLNDTVSTPKDTLDQVKQGCDVQIVSTPWSYVKSITHAGGGRSSGNVNVSQIDQYFERFDDSCDQYEEVSTRPIVGGKRNNSSKNPEFHKEKPAPKKVIETPPVNKPVNQNDANKVKGKESKGQRAGNA